MIDYKSIKDNKVSIYKNILINNGQVNAYYVLYPYNYAVMDFSSAGGHIERLHNVLSNLHSSLGEVKISMFKLRNIVSKQETINSIIRTVRMYDESYIDMPDDHKALVRNITKDFSILAVNIDVKNSIDVENQSLMGIIKSLLDNFVNENFSMDLSNVDITAVSSQNTRISNILQRFAVPANSKLVMNIYINSLFPSYNLVYNDYLIKNADSILGGVQQEIIPHFGWFEMTNSGIAGFGGTPRTTYGSVLTILNFPESIRSENFNINIPGLHVNMHLLPKDKAILKFKRMRADVKQEFEEAEMANNVDTNVDEDLDLVQRAVKNVRNGRIATEVDANILVISDTQKDLEKQKKKIISKLSDINVVCSIAADQAKTFINSFVKNAPREYYHIMDLEYALSFQLDHGILMGDGDSQFAAPVIGVSR